MNPLQNVAIAGREHVGSLVSVNPHYFVLSGLPLVSFSSLIMSELSWEKEEKKQEKNPAGNQQQQQNISTNHGQELDGSSIFGQT